MNLLNKIVLITGASSGIGEATAHRLAKEGARLILAARNEARLKMVENALTTQFSADCHRLLMDVSDRQSVFTQLENLPPEWKEIDILINNAGVALGKDPLFNYDIDDMDRMIDTNVKGLLYVTRAILPGMVSRNRGHIVNMGSTAGHDVYPGGNIYNATKFAVNALNQGIKMDVTGTAIRITSIDPGMVNTNFSTVRFKGNKEKADAVYTGMTPLTAGDIAETIYWVVSRPPHVNINQIILMPTDQSSNSIVSRNGERLFKS